MATREALPVRNAEGRFIGRIEGDTFIKEIYARHMLKKPPAICIDADPFDKLIRPICRAILVRDRESHVEYYTPMINFVTYKGEIERGHGRQYFMILERWQKR